MAKNRIWELDALRGLCILGMVAVHLTYDITALGITGWQPSPAFYFVMDWGGVVFLLLSGLCATLGSRCVRRGLTVLGCGLVVSAVTLGMYKLGMADRTILIYFGVLHCLGTCMILWHVLRKLPTAALAVLGTVLVAAGLWIRSLRVGTKWLIWLGLMYEGFATSDYFPLLPYLGFFLLGAVLGRLLYQEKRSLLPHHGTGVLSRLLQWVGRWSLPVYLLHQPAITGVIYLILLLQEAHP